MSLRTAVVGIADRMLGRYRDTNDNDLLNYAEQLVTALRASQTENAPVLEEKDLEDE